MAPKIEHLLTGFGVPEADCSVLAGRSEAAAVGREGDRVDVVGVAGNLNYAAENGEELREPHMRAPRETSVTWPPAAR
jgi:hypothetical protein